MGDNDQVLDFFFHPDILISSLKISVSIFRWKNICSLYVLIDVRPLYTNYKNDGVDKDHDDDNCNHRIHQL